MEDRADALFILRDRLLAELEHQRDRAAWRIEELTSPDHDEHVLEERQKTREVFSELFGEEPEVTDVDDLCKLAEEAAKDREMNDEMVEEEIRDAITYCREIMEVLKLIQAMNVQAVIAYLREEVAAMHEEFSRHHAKDKGSAYVVGQLGNIEFLELVLRQLENH